MRGQLSGAFILTRREAGFAVDRAVAAWPERDFAFLMTVRADYFVHRPGIPVLLGRMRRHRLLLAWRFKRPLGNPVEDGIYLRLQRDKPSYQCRNEPYNILIGSRASLRSFAIRTFFHSDPFLVIEVL